MKKDTDIVAKEVLLIILDSKSVMCMDNNGKDTKQTMQISRRVHFVRNGENWKMHKIDCCEVGLKLSDIATKDVGENDLNTIINYIMVRLHNWERTLVQEGWYNPL